MISIRTATATAVMAVLLSACATGNAPGVRKDRIVTLGKMTVLGYTQTAVLPDGSRLTYISTTNDSRCKPKVQCVWAGKADANFRYAPVNGAAYNFSMEIPRELHRKVGRYDMELISIEPYATPPAVMIFR